MLNDTIQLTFKDAAKKLTGQRKREFIAKVTEDYSEMGYSESQLPTRQTIGEILNRMGYRLKKLKKQNH
jgi:hypothetical protein